MAEIISKNDASAFDEDGEQKDISPSKWYTNSRLRQWSMLIGSIILTVLFAYSAIVQYNDTDSVYPDMTFYVFHFVLSVSVSMQQTFRCYKQGRDVFAHQVIFWGVASAMGCWSVALIAIPATKFPLEGEAGDMGGDMGGDNNAATLKEELVLEITGAVLGLFSVGYHVVWIQLCTVN